MLKGKRASIQKMAFYLFLYHSPCYYSDNAYIKDFTIRYLELLFYSFYHYKPVSLSSS